MGGHETETVSLTRTGNRFSFTILTNAGNNLRKNTATIIQWRLEKIGIKVEIRTVEWSTFVNQFIDKKRFEAVLLGWSIGLDADQYDIWHSSKTKEKELNFISYSNPEVDELLEKGRRTFDIEERKKAYFRIQEILAEEVPYHLPLCAGCYADCACPDKGHQADYLSE